MTPVIKHKLPVGSHSVTLVGLTPEKNYHFEVTSADAAQNTTTDSGHSFTTLPIPPILFVDDDEGDAMEGYFTDALDANGYDYDTWNVQLKAASPTAADMTAYQVVIWNIGDDYNALTAGLTNSEQASLMPRSTASLCRRTRTPLRSSSR